MGAANHYIMLTSILLPQNSDILMKKLILKLKHSIILSVFISTVKLFSALE